jgi:hypothetical protein
MRYRVQTRIAKPLKMSEGNSSLPVFQDSRDPNDMQNTISKNFIPTSATDLATLDQLQNPDESLVMKGRSPTTMRYFQIVEKLSPNELLKKFAETAPKNVQEAAKSTIVTVLGTLPNYALDAAMITTSSKLANLLYQMQLTGYMFKNAEYRMSFTKSLKGLPRVAGQNVIEKGNVTFSPGQQGTRVAGDVRVRTAGGEDVVVKADELMSALSKEVQELRSELALVRGERESELRSNLLTYIQALPEKELAKLTSDMSDDVIQSIQMLINALMERLGIDMTGPEVVVQQSVGALAQLCMWQMVVGYNLRELEAFDRGTDFISQD